MWYLSGMVQTTPIIRPATDDDMPDILSLVIELAVYEREPEAVKTTPDHYLRDLRDNWFQAIVADHQGKLVGAAIFYPAYSTWKGRMIYLEDLIVTESWRHKGVGTRLFQAVIDHAKERKANLVKWQVLSWNEPALAFYARWDAPIDVDWWNGKIHLPELSQDPHPSRP